MEPAPITKDHRCSVCMCYMPWAHRHVIQGSMTPREYRVAQYEHGRWEELIKNHNRVVAELREAKQELKKLRRQLRDG